MENIKRNNIFGRINSLSKQYTEGEWMLAITCPDQFFNWLVVLRTIDSPPKVYKYSKISEELIMDERFHEIIKEWKK